MKRLLAAWLALAVGMMCLVACTPKPARPEPVVQAFAEALRHTDFARAAKQTDDPESITQAFNETRAGLQAEGLDVQVDAVHTGDTQASAVMTLVWKLPKGRTFRYRSSATVLNVGGQWVIRATPLIVHPRLGFGQHLELRRIPPKRASVIAADGRVVLRPAIAYRILIDPRQASAPTAAMQVVTAINGMRKDHPELPALDAAAITQAMRGGTSPYSVVVVDEAVGKQVASQLAGNPAIRLNKEAVLTQRDDRFAPAIIDRVKHAVAATLEGNRGWYIAITNEHGAIIDTLERHEPDPAPTVRLTLDPRIQEAAQKAVDLRPEMKTQMVIIRPSNGAILAIAQTKKADEDGPVALVGQYPPGSTFKMITASAGMMFEGLSPSSIVPCPGTLDIGHRIVTNYNAFSLGNVPLERAFAASCNTSFANISARLAPGQLQQVGKQFGLGVDYQIPGLNTVTGQIPKGETLVDRTEAGFGQGKDLVSPFGLALVAATAAHGVTPNPHLIEGMKTVASEPSTPVPPAVIANLQQIMRAVVTRGTARGMRAGGDIHGKTGEAEIQGGSHAWFAGYRDDIAFATLIPYGGGSESAVAVTDAFLQHLNEADVH